MLHLCFAVELCAAACIVLTTKYLDMPTIHLDKPSPTIHAITKQRRNQSSNYNWSMCINARCRALLSLLLHDTYLHMYICTPAPGAFWSVDIDIYTISMSHDLRVSSLAAGGHQRGNPFQGG